MKLPDWLLNWIIINHILNWMLPWTAFLILPRWLTASYFIFVSYAEKITNITVSQWLSVWLQKHSHETVINIQRTTPPQAKHFSHSASVFLSVMVSTCSYYLSTVFVCVCVWFITVWRFLGTQKWGGVEQVHIHLQNRTTGRVTTGKKRQVRGRTPSLIDACGVKLPASDRRSRPLQQLTFGFADPLCAKTNNSSGVNSDTRPIRENTPFFGYCIIKDRD